VHPLDQELVLITRPLIFSKIFDHRSAFFGGQRATALSEFEPWHEFPNGTASDSEEGSPVGFGKASVALAMCAEMATGTMGPQSAVALVEPIDQAGMAVARARGRNGGRPHSMTAANLRLEMASLPSRDTKVAVLCAELGVARADLLSR
jgi:hypothetical protein